MEISKPAFFLLIAYLLGSIPFGVLISKIYQTDIRKVGSKSTGATNVLRTVGKKPALLTLLGDVGKGIAAVLLGEIFFSSLALIAGMGLIAIIGHDWPIFAKFHGGKGVAIGHETEQADWDKLAIRILENNEDWVVQRYVAINEMPIPVAKNGTFELQIKKFNINPFIFNGKYAGSVTRLSDQSVINVSAGGGLVPVIEYQKS